MGGAAGCSGALFVNRTGAMNNDALVEKCHVRRVERTKSCSLKQEDR